MIGPLDLYLIARVLRTCADSIEDLAAEQKAEHRDWIDQVASQLGARRHIAAVRRRVAAGKGDAAMVGRRALLSADAHAEELAAVSRRSPLEQTPVSGPDALRARLGLIDGGRK